MQFPHVLSRRPVSTGFGQWITSIRRRLEDSVNAWLPEPEAALLIAVAIGAHTAALGDLGKPLIASGLIHVVAMSGVKVALVAGMLYQLSALTGRGLVALVLPVSGITVLPLLPALIILGFVLGTVIGTLLHAITSVALAVARLPGVSNAVSVAPFHTALYYLLLIPVMAYALRRENFAPPGGGHDLDASVVVTLAALLALGTASVLIPTHRLGTDPRTSIVVATGAGRRQQHELVFNSGLRTVGEAILHSADGYDAAFTQSLRDARVFSDSQVRSLSTYVLHPASARFLYPQS